MGGKEAEDELHEYIMSGTALKQNSAGGAVGGTGWACVKDVIKRALLCILSQRINMQVAG